jgi:glycosyltransferase involved in cell wall biosynthesis
VSQKTNSEDLSNITCIILTFNEENNIGPAIESLNWVDDLIVVDSYSTDATIQNARLYRPDVRIFQNRFVDFGHQRNWALERCNPKHQWVLFLDADERSTLAFESAVKCTLGKNTENVGYYLTYRNIFLGRWLKRSTFYPSWQLRLLKLGHVTYRPEGHGQREITSGPLGRIDTPYDHFPFDNGLECWLAKHNHYSSKECDLIEQLRREPLRIIDGFSQDPLRRRRFMKRIAARVWFRPIVRFFYTYLFRGGFLDGMPGYIYCRLMAQYEFQLWAKLKERQAQS